MRDLFSDQSRNPSAYVPERIREAREARGFSCEEFADRIGVSRQALAQYELGQTLPRPEVMSAIIGVTAQPTSFFTKAQRHASPNLGHPFWRDLKRTRLTFRNRTVRRLEWALEITKHIENSVNLPSVNLPSIEFDPDWPEDVWIDAVETIADAVRRHWGLSSEPISGFERHIEANGIVLIQDQVLTDGMDAVSRWQAGRPYILYAKETVSAVRVQYNLAHELGHIVLHAGVEVNAKNLSRIEKQADRFAGAFLLPQKTFAREALRSSLNHFLFLKKRWKVSIAAMVYRAKDLGIISENQYKYLWRQMNAEGIRRREPLDDVLPIPTPTMLRDATKMILDNGVQTAEQFQSDLALNSEDISDLIAADYAMFESPVVQIQLESKVANDNT